MHLSESKLLNYLSNLDPDPRVSQEYREGFNSALINVIAEIHTGNLDIDE